MSGRVRARKAVKLIVFYGFSDSMALQLISSNVSGLNLIENNQNQLLSLNTDPKFHAWPHRARKPGKLSIFKRLSDSIALKLISSNVSGLNLIENNQNQLISPNTDPKFHAWPHPSAKTWKIERFQRIIGFNSSATYFFKRFWAESDRY